MSNSTMNGPLIVVKFLQARTVTAKQLLPAAVKISAEALGAVNALLSSLAEAFVLTDIESALSDYFSDQLLNLIVAALHPDGQGHSQDWLWPPSVTSAALSSATKTSPETLENMHSVLNTVARFIMVDLLAKHSSVTGSSSVRAEHVSLQVGACADLAKASVKLQWPILLASLPSLRAPSAESSKSNSGAGRVPDQQSATTTIDDSVARTSTSLHSLLATDSNPSPPDPENQATSRGRPLNRRLSYRPLVHSLSASPSRRVVHSPSSTSTTSSSAASINFQYSPPPPIPAVPPLVVPEFDDLIQSSQTVKFSLTPTRIRSLDTSSGPPPGNSGVERGRHLSIDTSDPNTSTPVAPRANIGNSYTYSDSATPTSLTDVSPLSTIDGSPMDSLSSPAADSPTTPAKKKKSGILAMFRSTTNTKSKKDTGAKRDSLASLGDPASTSMGGRSAPSLPVPVSSGLKKSASSTIGGDQMAVPPTLDTSYPGGGAQLREERPPRSPIALSLDRNLGMRSRTRSLSQPTSPRPVNAPPPRDASPVSQEDAETPRQPSSSRQAGLTVTTTIPTSSLPLTTTNGAPPSAGVISSVASSPTVVASPNTAVPPVPVLNYPSASSDLPLTAIRSRTTSARVGNAGEIADVVDLYCSSASPVSNDTLPIPTTTNNELTATSPSSVTAIRHHHESDTSGDDERDGQLLARRRYSPRSDSIQGTLSLMQPTSPTSSSTVGTPGSRRASEPLVSGPAGAATNVSRMRRSRAYTSDGTGAGESLSARTNGEARSDDRDEDMRSTVSFGSNITNYSSSAHPSSVGPPLPTSWSTPSTPPPFAQPHPRVPPLPSTLHALPPASLLSLVQSLHTHLTLTVYELDAANDRHVQVQTRLDTLATKAVRKITDLQQAVESKDQEIAELRNELGEVRGRLERVVGLVASVVPGVVSQNGNGAGNGADE